MQRTVRFSLLGWVIHKIIVKMACQSSRSIHVPVQRGHNGNNCSGRRLICDLREIEHLLSLPFQAYTICHIDL